MHKGRLGWPLPQPGQSILVMHRSLLNSPEEEILLFGQRMKTVEESASICVCIRH